MGRFPRAYVTTLPVVVTYPNNKKNLSKTTVYYDLGFVSAIGFIDYDSMLLAKLICGALSQRGQETWAVSRSYRLKTNLQVSQNYSKEKQTAKLLAKTSVTVAGAMKIKPKL